MRRTTKYGGALALSAVACLGCGEGGGPAGPQVRFVRGGLIVPASPNGESVPAGGRFILQPWQPGALVEAGTGERMRAPELPTLNAWWTYPLGEVAAETAGGNLPDTALAFAPDSRALAVSTFDGALQTLDTATGKVRWERRIAPAYYKTLAYLPSGSLLIAGEQGEAMHVTAFNADSGAVAWRVELDDSLGERSPPRVTGRWARYAAPAVVALLPLSDDRIVVATTHSWNTDAGWQRYSRILCLDARGAELWRFPTDGPLRQSVLQLATDRGSCARIAFAANGTPPDPASARLATTGVGVLDANSGAWERGYAFEPLRPHFEEAYIWQGVALSHDGSRLVVGLTDGRAAVFEMAERGDTWHPTWHELGTPLEVGDVFVGCPVSYAFATPEALYIQTNDSRVPLGTTGLTQRAPAPHPNAGAIWRLAPNGAPAGRYQGPFTCDNFAASADGSLLVSATAPGPEHYAHARHGLLFLDATTVPPRPLGQYAIAGPAFFRPQVSPDGFFAAIVECPGYDATTHTRYGRYQVHLVH